MKILLPITLGSRPVVHALVVVINSEIKQSNFVKIFAVISPPERDASV